MAQLKFVVHSFSSKLSLTDHYQAICVSKEKEQMNHWSQVPHLPCFSSCPPLHHITMGPDLCALCVQPSTLYVLVTQESFRLVLPTPRSQAGLDQEKGKALCSGESECCSKPGFSPEQTKNGNVSPPMDRFPVELRISNSAFLSSMASFSL